jgi:hypothetical protein
MAEVSRARMDFPSYPVDIVLPSFNHADTAHDQFFFGIGGGTEGGALGDALACESLRMSGAVSLMPISA